MAKNNGFSLTEVLMAVGILSIGMMLVATMFPAALYLTTIASERTMAAIVADEAFAKIQFYGLEPPYPTDVNDYNDISMIDSNEFSYPPVDPCASNRQYYWSALFKPISTDPNDGYLVTVFVARKTSPNHKYYGGGDSGKRPKAVLVSVNVQTDANELKISAGNEMNVNPPTTVLDNGTCKIYRVIERKIDEPNVVQLDRDWENGSGSASIWLVPPPQSGGKNADIEVFQRIMRF